MPMEIKQVNNKEGGDRRQVSLHPPRVSAFVSDFTCFHASTMQNPLWSGGETSVVQRADVRPSSPVGWG